MKLTKEQMAKVESVLSQMTLEEKIGQMNQESPSIVGGFDVPFSELIEMLTDGRLPQEEFERLMSTAKQDFHEEEIRAGLVGSVMGNDPRKANELQRIAVEETRLGIPLIIGFDVIHGLRSVFPIAIAEAGSFDDGLFEEGQRSADCRGILPARRTMWRRVPSIISATEPARAEEITIRRPCRRHSCTMSTCRLSGQRWRKALRQLWQPSMI